MKQFSTYESIPSSAIYLGSENGNGEMGETLADMILEAINPATFKDNDGIRHYFDLIEPVFMALSTSAITPRDFPRFF